MNACLGGCLGVFLLFSSVNVRGGQGTGSSSVGAFYQDAYVGLTTLGIDPGAAAHVKNVTITRDVASFRLEEGELYLCGRVLHQRCAALFLGHGMFSYTPPRAIEADQLDRFYEKRSLNEPFEVLLLIFADSTSEELQRNLLFRDAPSRDEGRHDIDACMNYLKDDEGKSFDVSVMKTILDGRRNGLFYAVMNPTGSSPMFFKIDPYQAEAVSFMRRSEGHWWEHEPEVVNRFSPKDQTGRDITDAGANRDFLSVTAYRIAASIEENLDFSAVADMELRSLADAQNAVVFYLYSELKVDSVVWGDGRRADFFKGDNGSLVWIRCSPQLNAGEHAALRFWYHGDLLTKDDERAGWVLLKQADFWYPRYGWGTLATYDLTFQIPSSMKLASVGELVERSTQGEVTTSHWSLTSPSYNASFNVGYFKESTVTLEGGMPPVTIYTTDIGGRELTDEVGSAVAGSIQFFSNVFGKPSIAHMNVTEIPALHGEAFPGLIHLSLVTFRMDDEVAEELDIRDPVAWNEVFRSHEVAHQWWGIGVDFRTYHDQWLSEGFAQFSGLWYMQAALRDNKKYFGMLEEWKDQIFSNRKFLFGSGQQAGPISLGYRTRSSKTRGDYGLIVYKKGAWVLNMLRAMMVDLKTMNEDAFKNMMRDFYSSYRGKKASTRDFQGIVEKHLGIDMSWFFRQWIDDTRIPKYQFSYKAEEVPGGKFKIHCRVKQLNVAEDFQMYVPLTISFGGDRFARLRTLVKGATSEFDLPLMPMRPEKIVFNDLEAVLCEVEYVDWE